MRVACPGCGKPITVPADKATIPGLRGRCRCGTVFAVAQAAPFVEGVSTTAPGVAPVAPAAPSRVPPPIMLAEVAPGQPSTLATLPLEPPPLPTVAARPASAAAAVAAAAVPAPGAAKPAHPRPVSWRKCQNHPQGASSFVCNGCNKGWCDACVLKVREAALCPGCENLCITTARRIEDDAIAERRARPLFDDLGLIFTYPFRDPVAYGMLAVFVFAFGFVHGGLAQGVLIWYAFHAVTKVSNGNLRDFMPDFTDVADLMRPARLALAAFLVSSAPLFLVMALVPGAAVEWMWGDTRVPAVHAAQPAEPLAEEPEEPAEPSGEASPGTASDRETAAAMERMAEDMAAAAPRSALALPLLVLAFAWKVVYMPVALTVGALSRSFLSTINPVIGIGTIVRMGAVYWQAMAVYTVLSLVQWGVGWAVDGIPIIGALVRSVVDAYAFLAIGCVLGLGVFKKATELGWD